MISTTFIHLITTTHYRSFDDEVPWMLPVRLTGDPAISISTLISVLCHIGEPLCRKDILRTRLSVGTLDVSQPTSRGLNLEDVIFFKTISKLDPLNSGTNE